MALIVLDAGVAIGLLDPDDAAHEASVAVLTTHAADDVRLPASALAETLVGPTRRGRADEARAALDALALAIVPLDEDIAVRAAGLRARHRSLRLPDALVAATADALEADVLFTTDRRLARLPRVSLVAS